MNLYSYSNEQLEDHADQMKSLTVRGLVESGIIDEEVAEEWAESHTLIKRKKSFFRAVSDRFFNGPDNSPSGELWMVVTSKVGK